MAVTPRREEVEAVVAVLESDEHEDSVSMAKALIRVVAEQLQRRTQTHAAMIMRRCTAPLVPCQQRPDDTAAQPHTHAARAS